MINKLTKPSLFMVGALCFALTLAGCSGGGVDVDGDGDADFDIVVTDVVECTGSNNQVFLKIDFCATGNEGQSFDLLFDYFFDDIANDQFDMGSETRIPLTLADEALLMSLGIDTTGYFDPQSVNMLGSGETKVTGTFFWDVSSDLPFGGDVCLLLDAANVPVEQTVNSALMCDVMVPNSTPTTTVGGDSDATPGPNPMVDGRQGISQHFAVNLFDQGMNEIVIGGGITNVTSGGTAVNDILENLGVDAAMSMTSTASGPFTKPTPRVDHCASFFYDAQGNVDVLVTGGSMDFGSSLNTTDIFSADALAPGPTMNESRQGHACCWLPNNTVLVTGGFGGAMASTTAEIYDPIANTFTTVPFAMPISRSGHTCCLLPDGRVLLAGGTGSIGLGAESGTSGGNQSVTFDLKLHQNGQNPWAVDANGPTIDRINHTATVLVNGVCYLIGGESISTGEALSTAHAYRPFDMVDSAMGVNFPSGFSSSQDMLGLGRARHAASRLGSGEILVTGGLVNFAVKGGGAAEASVLGLVTETAEVFLPECFTAETLGLFSPAADLAQARFNHSQTTVNSGSAVIVGGESDFGTTLDSAEIYAFSNTAPTVSGIMVDNSATNLANVPINFTLADNEGDKAFVIVQYSTDGTNFSFATLTSYADTVNLAPGMQSVSWNAMADGITGGSVTVRIIPVGGTFGQFQQVTANL